MNGQLNGFHEAFIEEGTFLFTSESVGEGHPDKICDQISDAVLDAHLQQDPDAKVACETVAKTGMILLAGEITSRAAIDYQKVVREAIKHIGYDDSSKGSQPRTSAALVYHLTLSSTLLRAFRTKLQQNRPPYYHGGYVPN